MPLSGQTRNPPSSTLIQLGREKKAKAEEKLKLAEERLKAAQKEFDQANLDVLSWESFIKKAFQLSNESAKDGSRNGQSQKSSDLVIRVQNRSIAAQAVKLIQAKGPQSLSEIVGHLVAEGKGESNREFARVVNSGLWRRRNDLFARVNGKFVLRNEAVELVD